MAWVEGSCPREAFRRGIMNVQREFLQRNIPENWAAFAATNFYSRFWPGKVAVHSSLQLFSLLAPLLSRIVSPSNIIIHISRYNKKKKKKKHGIADEKETGRIYAKRVFNAFVTKLLFSSSLNFFGTKVWYDNNKEKFWKMYDFDAAIFQAFWCTIYAMEYVLEWTDDWNWLYIRLKWKSDNNFVETMDIFSNCCNMKEDFDIFFFIDYEKVHFISISRNSN